jgi:hypothetical protein
VVASIAPWCVRRATPMVEDERRLRMAAKEALAVDALMEAPTIDGPRGMLARMAVKEVSARDAGQGPWPTVAAVCGRRRLTMAKMCDGLGG